MISRAKFAQELCEIPENSASLCVLRRSRLAATKAAHTRVTAPGCELIMSASSARPTAMQTNGGKPQFPESGQSLCVRRGHCAWPRGASRLDGWLTTVREVLCVTKKKSNSTSGCFTHFPSASGAPRLRNATQGRPAAICRLVAPRGRGADRAMHRGIPSIRASNRQKQSRDMRTVMSKAQTQWVRPNSAPSHSTQIKCLYYHRGEQQPVWDSAADNTDPGVPSAFLENTTAVLHLTLFCALFRCIFIISKLTVLEFIPCA